MYAKWINQFKIISAPSVYWNIRDFNKKPELMMEHGFLPVIPSVPQPHKRPSYKVTNGKIITEYVEYTGSELNTYREKLIGRLMAAYKGHEQKYLNSSDLTMASTLAVGKQPKGTAVALWVSGLWERYFIEKGKILSAASSADFAKIEIAPWKHGEPPYKMSELSEECAALYSQISTTN